MKLFEYQAKELFRTYGLPIPKSVLIHKTEEVATAFSRLNHPVAIKAQVLAGGRGKAGGIAIVKDEESARTEAQRIFGLSISGEVPKSLLLEESYPHDNEMYLSVTLDRGERSFVTIGASEGGVDVESMSGKIIRKIPLGGIDQAFAAEVASLLKL